MSSTRSSRVHSGLHEAVVLGAAEEPGSSVGQDVDGLHDDEGTTRSRMPFGRPRGGVELSGNFPETARRPALSSRGQWVAERMTPCESQPSSAIQA